MPNPKLTSSLIRQRDIDRANARAASAGLPSAVACQGKASAPPPASRRKPGAQPGNQNAKGHHMSEANKKKLSAALIGNQRAKGNRGGHGPSGPRNGRWQHGAYATPSRPIHSLDDVVEDLFSKQGALSARLDDMLAEGSADHQTLIKIFALHAENATRLSHVLRDQRALSGAAADGIAGAIAQALDELSSELGTDL